MSVMSDKFWSRMTPNDTNESETNVSAISFIEDCRILFQTSAKLTNKYVHFDWLKLKEMKHRRQGHYKFKGCLTVVISLKIMIVETAIGQPIVKKENLDNSTKFYNMNYNVTLNDK